MTQALLEKIRTDPEVRTLLGDTFDSYLVDDAQPIDWFTVDGTSKLRVIAKKGSGCAFLLFGDDERLGFVSSEGQAGIIAPSLAEGLSLIVAYPYWESLIAEDIETMHDLVEDEEDCLLGDIEDADEHRAIVDARLGCRRSTIRSPRCTGRSQRWAGISSLDRRRIRTSGSSRCSAPAEADHAACFK
jgi:hypothetical protein